jgi:hypothetical protein
MRFVAAKNKANLRGWTGGISAWGERPRSPMKMSCGDARPTKNALRRHYEQG